MKKMGHTVKFEEKADKVSKMLTLQSDLRGEFKFKRDNVNKTKTDAVRKNFISYDFSP
jgi:hypothetical protein